MSRQARRPVRKARMQDVARAAGVSTATVSRVANGSDSVTPVVRERVIKVALKLGFDLERKKRSKIIAFILSNRRVLHPFHSAVLVGAEAYCADHDYGVLFLPFQYSAKVPWQDLQLPQILLRHQIIRAVIVAGTNSQNLLELLSRKGIPFVVLGNNVVGQWQQDRYSAVYFDDLGGAYDMTRYLQSLGHRHIWYVGNCRMPWFARRCDGYRRAMEEAGLMSYVGDMDAESGEDLGYLATKSILRSGEPLTAIFAGEDAAARGTYKALRDSGLMVPDAVSVAGFNDTPEATALNPLLTSVRVFTDQVGRQMAKLVLRKIGRPDLEPEVVTVPTQLVKRESCRPLVREDKARIDEEPRAVLGA